MKSLKSQRVIFHTPRMINQISQGEPIAYPMVKLRPRVVKLRARVVKLRAWVVKLRARVVKLRVRGIESGMLGSQTACPRCQTHTVCTKALILLESYRIHEETHEYLYTLITMAETDSTET